MTESTESTAEDAEELHPEVEAEWQQVLELTSSELEQLAAREGYANGQDYLDANPGVKQKLVEKGQEKRMLARVKSGAKKLKEDIPELADQATGARFEKQLMDEGMTQVEIAQLLATRDGRRQLQDRWQRQQSSQPGRRKTIPKIKKNGQSTSSQADHEPHGLHGYASLLYGDEKNLQHSGNRGTSTPDDAVEILYGAG